MSNPRNYQGTGDLIYSAVGHKIHMLFPDLQATSKHRGLHRLYSTKDIDFYCIFKKERLHKFNNLYPEFVKNNPDYKGQGESINCEVLYDLCHSEKKTYLIFAYNTQDIYLCHPKAIMEFCSNNGLVRKQFVKNKVKSNGEQIIITETTFNPPFNKNLFHNFREWIELNKEQIKSIEVFN